MPDDEYVWVRRQWNGSSAKFRWEDFNDPHWSQESGGRGDTQPRLMIFGYVSCQGAIEGEIGHSGSHGACPHRIKVCVVAKDNTSIMMSILTGAANLKGRPPARETEAERVLRALEDNGGELLNRALRSKALLTKAHGDETLGRLVQRGAINSERIMAPNRAGRMQEQVLWRLIAA